MPRKHRRSQGNGSSAVVQRAEEPARMSVTRRLIHALQADPVLWLLAAVPAVFVAEVVAPDSHTLLFVLSVLAIVPLASLLSFATESVAAKTGDAIGGLLNATLGNLTELVIAITALRAGMLSLVKASIAGAIVTNSLFILGTALLLGGLKHKVQLYNADTARLQGGMLFLAVVALLVPSMIGASDRPDAAILIARLSIGLSILLLVAYALGLVFSLWTHRHVFASVSGPDHGDLSHLWPVKVAGVVLVVVTVTVALVSEIFVMSVQHAATAFGMTPAFVGFIVVALVGAAAEMATAFAAARKNRLDLSIGIALGSSSQIAMFVAPVLVLLSFVIGPQPMDLHFWPGAVVMVTLSTLTVILVANGGRSAWYLGVMLLVVYATFAMTLYLLPPAA
jgi:Ca2+:H+ antiporter